MCALRGAEILVKLMIYAPMTRFCEVVNSGGASPLFMAGHRPVGIRQVGLISRISKGSQNIFIEF